MSFTIVRTNGTVLAIIPDGDLNTTSSPLFLPGRNYPGYGSVIDTNFVRTLENYAFTAPPENALQGQLWFNTNNNSLCVCPVDGEANAENWIRLVTNDNTLDIEVANVYADHIFANGATFAETVTANLVETDYLTVNVQANIANLDVSDEATLNSVLTTNLTSGSNTTAANITGAWSLDGTLTSNGNITSLGFRSDNYRYANGQLIDFKQADGNTGEIQFNTSGTLNTSPDFTFNTSDSSLTVVGNISGVNFNTTFGGVYTGNGSGLSAIPAANLTGTLSSAIQSNITQVGALVGLTVTGNVNAANVSAVNNVIATNLTGTLTTPVQTNITDVGTLNTLTVSGNITSANMYANGGTVGATNLTGTLTTSSQPNITSVGTLTSAAVTGNVTAGNVYANSGRIGASLLTGTLTTAAQPNVTSVGTLTSLNVTGNVSAGSVSGAQLTGVLTTASQPNITSVGTLTSAAVSGNLTSGNVYANSGTIGAQTLKGEGGNISNVQGSNVSGEVDFAAVANSVAVANVSGIGNVALLNIDGNASNILYGNGVFASAEIVGGEYGNSNVVALLSSFGSNTISTTGIVTANTVNASNVVSARLTGVLTTNAQPNVTSLGSLTSLIVLGNINSANVSGNHFGNGAGLSNINGSNVTGLVANATYATTAGSISSIPSGTKMIFAQTNAPTGWTKLTSNDNAALRVVSGSAGVGGSVNFTSAFTNQTVAGTTGSTTLSESQLPTHSHFVARNIKVNSGNVAPFGPTTYLARETDIGGDTEYNLQATYSAPDSMLSSSVGSGSGHDHTFSGSLNLAVKYVDVIIAQKD